MEYSEVLDNYRKLLSPILKCKKDDIRIFRNNKEANELCFSKTDIGGNWSLGNYSIVINNGSRTVVSTFKLYQLPHCCAFMVSCDSIVCEKYRGRGIGTILNSLRKDIGKALGYSAIICTDIEQNVNQRKLLATNGWKDIHSIINKRTNNKVYLSAVNI